MQGDVGQWRHLPRQPISQCLQPLLCCLESTLLTGINIDNQTNRAGQVVEYQHFLGHHQQDIRRPHLVRRSTGLQARLYVTHGVIAEIAHQSTVEDRQVGLRCRLVTKLKRLGVGQWIGHLFALGHNTIHPDLCAMVIHFQKRTAGQADD